MIRSKAPRHDTVLREVQDRARNLAVEIADRTLRSMARGQWSFDFAESRDVQAMAMNVLRLERMMHPVCVQSFADQCVPLMAQHAQIVAAAAREAASLGQFRCCRIEDELLLDERVDMNLVPAYAVIVVPA